MIDRGHDLGLTKQAALLGISRGSVYYQPVPVSAEDLALMRRMDELHLEFPFAGARMLRDLLAAEGSRPPPTFSQLIGSVGAEGCGHVALQKSIIGGLGP